MAASISVPCNLAGIMRSSKILGIKNSPERAVFLWFYVNSWGREKGNRLKRCREYSRHCFYVWQNRIRLLKLWKLRMPKHTRFRTFVLLLQPSMKPFDQGTSIEFKISRNQLRYALIQSENSGRPIVSADRSQSISFGFPAADDLARITSRNSFFSRYASASLGAISNIRASRSISSFESFAIGFIRRHLDLLKYFRNLAEGFFCSFFLTRSIAQ